MGLVKRAFPPIIGPRPTTLILGSMPGEASLAAGQYYAFARNHFWPIMGELVGASPMLPYADRIKRLQRARLALWDVLEQCEREGSLDSAINETTLVVNDFAALLARHRTIRRICFNGKSVARLFRVHVLATQQIPGDIELLTLPSTSPANARLSFDDKLKHWAVLRDAIRQ